MSLSIAPVLIDRELSTTPGVRFVQGINGTSTSTLSNTTSGNLIVIFINQALATTGVPTASGFTIDGTNFCSYNTSATYQVFYGYMISPGGNITPNPVSPHGAIEGLVIYEIYGASTTVDAVSPAQTIAPNSVTSTPSESMTTTNAGDIVLCGIGLSNTTGTIDAWTGTGPMANISTGSVGNSFGAAFGGYYIPGSTLSGATFTANWTTARAAGIQAVAFKPSSNYTKVAWLS